MPQLITGASIPYAIEPLKIPLSQYSWLIGFPMAYHNGSIFIGKPQGLAPCTQHPQHEDLPGHRIKDLLHGRPQIRAADDRAEGRRFGPGHGLWDPHCLGELQGLGNCWWFFSKWKWREIFFEKLVAFFGGVDESILEEK